MPDTFARMRQITGTSVEWAANDLVIGYGEIAVELTGANEARIKIGDGSRRFSALPYASSQATSVAWDNVTGRPTTFPPSTHNHSVTQVVDLVDAGGKLSLSLMPQSILEKMDWRGEHTPTPALEYPLSPLAGDTWGIAGPAYTFTAGPLAGRTVGVGSAIVFDNNTWFAIGGGPGSNPADFVQVSDLVTTTTGPPQAGKVPQLNTSGRLDPSFINVPGQLFFRGTVDITQPPPVGVNSGDYWLVGVAGVAHAGWTGIAGQTLAVNDMVIWNGVVWTFTRSPGAASGFVPIDGSAPMTGPLSLAPGAPTAAAHAVRRDYLLAQIAAIPSAVAQLGFTPLNPANNLSEVVDDAVARANIGLGTAATMAATAFLQPANNLSDVPDDSVARGNLGLGGAAVRADTFFLQTAQNLADVPDKAVARINLGVPDLADIILKSIVDAPGDLIVATAADTVARLAKGPARSTLRAGATGLQWDPADYWSIGATGSFQMGNTFTGLIRPDTTPVKHLDSDNLVSDLANGVVTFKRAGLYRVEAQGFFGLTAGPAPAQTVVSIRMQRGSTIIWHYESGTSVWHALGLGISVSCLLDAQVGDTVVALWGNNTPGTGVTIVGSASGTLPGGALVWFSGTRIA